VQSSRNLTTNLAAAEHIVAQSRECLVRRHNNGWVGVFEAMASPCEVHIAGGNAGAARSLVDAIADEAWRIERKFSRYIPHNIVDKINSANSEAVTVDEETGRLITYAGQLFELSEGRFDITSGVLRRAWKFDGGKSIPSRSTVAGLLSRVGWSRTSWNPPKFRMPTGMQIDFGGIGKEYAVDRAGQIAEQCSENFLINFGGDLVARGKGTEGSGWTVGIESAIAKGLPCKRIRLRQAALATSGDTYRFIENRGPGDNAPRSVTVAASSCTSAGMLATFAMLHGADAEVFLESQGVQYWCLR